MNTGCDILAVYVTSRRLTLIPVVGWVEWLIYAELERIWKETAVG
jgi:hypothetical protein